VKRNRARIVTPWNLSVGVNLSLFLTLWLAPLAPKKLQIDPDEQRNLIGRPDLTREVAAVTRLVQSNSLLRTVEAGE
jgi:hypothetical protein